MILSHRVWMEQYGGDPGVIGTSMEFSAGDAEIIGVMPEGFQFPSDRTE